MKICVIVSFPVPDKPKPGRCCHHRGFTLVELLVVIAIIGVLTSLLLPALSKAKGLAQRTTCLSNVKQMAISWRSFNDENDGKLVQSYPGTATAPNPNAWVLGNMTNINEAGSTALIALGQLYQFNNNTAIYHCPADRGVKIGVKIVPTVRSYSMNAYMGSRKGFGAKQNPAIPGYLPYYEKESDLQYPSKLWVLIEEDERTISDGFFTFDPTGTQYLGRLPATSAQRHNFGFTLAFGDGHAEIWRFSNPSTMKLSSASIPASGPINKDFEKLGQATAIPQ